MIACSCLLFFFLLGHGRADQRDGDQRGHRHEARERRHDRARHRQEGGLTNDASIYSM